MSIEIRKPTEEEIRSTQNWPTWKKETSEFPWDYSESETCLILSGQAEVKTAEGEKVEFGAGDWVVFPSGLSCTWRIKEAIEKKYQFGE